MGDGGSGKEPPDGRGGDKQRVYSKIRSWGNKAVAPPRQQVDLIQQKLATIVYEDDTRLKPMVHIANSVF